MARKDPRQLRLFPDPRVERARALEAALLTHGNKIQRLYALTRKVRAGVPGYARPEHVRRVRLRNRKLGLLAVRYTRKRGPVKRRLTARAGSARTGSARRAVSAPSSE